MEKTKCIKTYGISMPNTKFVGRCYHEEEKKNGTFGWIWGEWFAKDLFHPIETLIKDPSFIEEGNAYYGMCRVREETNEYWIGMIVPESAETPEGYDSFSIPHCIGVVNWVFGKEPDVYFHSCLENIEKFGYRWTESPSGERLMAERYVSPRFTEPDKEGNKILDLVYYTDF